MTTVDQNFTMWQGEDKLISVPVTENSSPKDMSAATAVTWVLLPKLRATVALTKTLASGVALYNAAATNDGLRITVASADTESLAAGSYYHECRVDDGGDEEVVFVGLVTLKRSRTNS